MTFRARACAFRGPYAIMLDGNVGYIPLSSLTRPQQTSSSVVEAVNRRRSQGLDPRPPWNEADISISGKRRESVPEQGQEISSVRGRGGDQQVFYATDSRRRRAFHSSSLPTAEPRLLQKSLRCSSGPRPRPHLGTTSFGKGLVQTVYPLDGGYALKMTRRNGTREWTVHPEGEKAPAGRSVRRGAAGFDGDRFGRKSRPKFRSDGVQNRLRWWRRHSRYHCTARHSYHPRAEASKSSSTEAQIVRATIINYAVEHKNKVQPGFVVAKPGAMVL